MTNPISKRKHTDSIDAVVLETKEIDCKAAAKAGDVIALKYLSDGEKVEEEEEGSEDEDEQTKKTTKTTKISPSVEIAVRNSTLKKVENVPTMKASKILNSHDLISPQIIISHNVDGGFLMVMEDKGLEYPLTKEQRKELEWLKDNGKKLNQVSEEAFTVELL